MRPSFPGRKQLHVPDSDHVACPSEGMMPNRHRSAGLLILPPLHQIGC